MGKYVDRNVIIATILVSAVFVNCIPTSVLINSKASNTADNNKVKRASPNPNPEPVQTSEKSTQQLAEKKPAPQKRGVNAQRRFPDLIDGVDEYFEDTDSGLVYPEIKELEEYQPLPYPYRPNINAYDNLQSILNNGYERPIAMPVVTNPVYPRYFPDRKKRSNGGLRLKDSKLSPAEMVALLELIEDRSRMDNSPYANNNLDFQNSPYELEGQEDNGEWWNSNAWAEPSVQYYGNPYNNNFELDSRYGGPNYYPSKRFMVAKKKRSLSPRENLAMEKLVKSAAAGPGGFDSRFTLGDLNAGGSSHKQHNKYF